MLSGLFAVQPANPAHLKPMLATPGIMGAAAYVHGDLFDPDGSEKWDASAVKLVLDQVPQGTPFKIGLRMGRFAPAAFNDPNIAMVEVDAQWYRQPRGKATVPVPFTPAYAAYVVNQHKAFASILDDLGRTADMVAVELSLWHSNDAELQLPGAQFRPNDAPWAAAGFRPTACAGVWGQMIEACAPFFPGVLIVVPTHDWPLPWVDDNGTVLTTLPKGWMAEQQEKLTAILADAFGMNAGLQYSSFSTVPIPGAWAAQAPQYGLRMLGQVNAWGGGLGCMTGPQTDPIPGTPAGFLNIIENAVDNYGVHYVEVHQADCTHSASKFAAANSLLEGAAGDSGG